MKFKRTTTALCIGFAAFFSISAAACSVSVHKTDCASAQQVKALTSADEDEFTVAGFNPANSSTDDWIVANVTSPSRHQPQLLIYFPGEAKPYVLDLAVFTSLLKAREITQLSAQLVAMPKSYVSKMKTLILGDLSPLRQPTWVAANH